MDMEGRPISTEISQRMLNFLTSLGWSIDCLKGNLLTSLVDAEGNKIFYELGRHNIELATKASTVDQILPLTQSCLNQLYEAAQTVGAVPYFNPVLPSDEDLLVIPDERDSVWLQLDGREALAPLARISAVQFTFSVSPQDAINVLNKFGHQINSFLTDFPQDAVWKQYITNSQANYQQNRYGGPLTFESMDEYCQALACHGVVRGTGLVPLENLNELDIPLHLRSIWWHFRLKRYGNSLCIEIRPIARKTDSKLETQLEKVLAIVSS